MEMRMVEAEFSGLGEGLGEGLGVGAGPGAVTHAVVPEVLLGAAELPAYNVAE